MMGKSCRAPGFGGSGSLPVRSFMSFAFSGQETESRGFSIVKRWIRDFDADLCLMAVRLQVICQGPAVV